jgi:hypothetical protein
MMGWNRLRLEREDRNGVIIIEYRDISKKLVPFNPIDKPPGIYNFERVYQDIFKLARSRITDYCKLHKFRLPFSSSLRWSPRILPGCLNTETKNDWPSSYLKSQSIRSLTHQRNRYRSTSSSNFLRLGSPVSLFSLYDCTGLQYGETGSIVLRG